MNRTLALSGQVIKGRTEQNRKDKCLLRGGLRRKSSPDMMRTLTELYFNWLSCTSTGRPVLQLEDLYFNWQSCTSTG